MKLYIPVIIALGLLLSGCAQFGVASKAVKATGATAADTVAQESEWVLCNAITVGAARRRYGRSQERAAAYNGLCENSGLIIEGVEE